MSAPDAPVSKRAKKNEKCFLCKKHAGPDGLVKVCSGGSRVVMHLCLDNGKGCHDFYGKSLSWMPTETIHDQFSNNEAFHDSVTSGLQAFKSGAGKDFKDEEVKQNNGIRITYDCEPVFLVTDADFKRISTKESRKKYVGDVPTCRVMKRDRTGMELAYVFPYHWRLEQTKCRKGTGTHYFDLARSSLAMRPEDHLFSLQGDLVFQEQMKELNDNVQANEFFDPTGLKSFDVIEQKLRADGVTLPGGPSDGAPRGDTGFRRTSSSATVDGGPHRGSMASSDRHSEAGKDDTFADTQVDDDCDDDDDEPPPPPPSSGASLVKKASTIFPAMPDPPKKATPKKGDKTTPMKPTRAALTPSPIINIAGDSQEDDDTRSVASGFSCATGVTESGVTTGKRGSIGHEGWMAKLPIRKSLTDNKMGVQRYHASKYFDRLTDKKSHPALMLKSHFKKWDAGQVIYYEKLLSLEDKEIKENQAIVYPSIEEEGGWPSETKIYAARRTCNAIDVQRCDSKALQIWLPNSQPWWLTQAKIEDLTAAKNSMTEEPFATRYGIWIDTFGKVVFSLITGGESRKAVLEDHFDHILEQLQDVLTNDDGNLEAGVEQSIQEYMHVLGGFLQLVFLINGNYKRLEDDFVDQIKMFVRTDAPSGSLLGLFVDAVTDSEYYQEWIGKVTSGEDGLRQVIPILNEFQSKLDTILSKGHLEQCDELISIIDRLPSAKLTCEWLDMQHVEDAIFSAIKDRVLLSIQKQDGENDDDYYANLKKLQQVACAAVCAYPFSQQANDWQSELGDKLANLAEKGRLATYGEKVVQFINALDGGESDSMAVAIFDLKKLMMEMEGIETPSDTVQDEIVAFDKSLKHLTKGCCLHQDGILSVVDAMRHRIDKPSDLIVIHEPLRSVRSLYSGLSNLKNILRVQHDGQTEEDDLDFGRGAKARDEVAQLQSCVLLALNHQKELDTSKVDGLDSVKSLLDNTIKEAQTLLMKTGEAVIGERLYRFNKQRDDLQYMAGGLPNEERWKLGIEPDKCSWADYLEHAKKTILKSNVACQLKPKLLQMQTELASIRKLIESFSVTEQYEETLKEAQDLISLGWVSFIEGMVLQAFSTTTDSVRLRTVVLKAEQMLKEANIPITELNTILRDTMNKAKMLKYKATPKTQSR